MTAGEPTTATAYDFEAESWDGQIVKLDAYRGKVLMIVNVASRCGFTPQYAALQALYRKYGDRGFVVLGFPCNQFGRQEPGTEDEIRRFCDDRYGVTFPLFARINVNGAAAHPLYVFLKSQRGSFLGSAIKWNFTKFLVDRSGQVVERFGSRRTPETIEPEIEHLL